MEQAQLVIGVILGTSAILGLLAGLIQKTVTRIVKNYLSELKPDGNGGHNLAGRVERIEIRVDRIYEMLIEDRLSR